MTAHIVSFRTTDKADPGDLLGIVGPKRFELDLTWVEADDLRQRLRWLEAHHYVEDVEIEPDRTTGKAAPIHELLDLFDPLKTP